jgi:nucleoid-associated protein YgaU
MSERPIAEVGPVACPFVAFEHDQARRSIEPDRRHRCYAEPVPAPRAISHQTTYCLSSGFAACPTFRAWAQRAAAGQVDAVPDAAGRAPREVPVAPMPQTVDPATMAPPIDDVRSTRTRAAPIDADDDLASLVRPASAAAAGAAYGAAFGSAEVPASEAVGDVPPFLATRPPSTGSTPPEAAAAAAARPRSGGQARPAARTLRRPARIDADAPAWEKPRRFEAYPTLRTRVGMPRVPTIAIAGVAVLAAALLLFVLPSMVAGPSATPTPTPEPSEASIAPVTPEPSPTPITYVVVAGDTLSKIARKHGVTNDELLAANPQITNPNRIKVGDEIVIPAPATEAEPSTEASPESSPSP